MRFWNSGHSARPRCSRFVFFRTPPSIHPPSHFSRWLGLSFFLLAAFPAAAASSSGAWECADETPAHGIEDGPAPSSDVPSQTENASSADPTSAEFFQDAPANLGPTDPASIGDPSTGGVVPKNAPAHDPAAVDVNPAQLDGPSAPYPAIPVSPSAASASESKNAAASPLTSHLPRPNASADSPTNSTANTASKAEAKTDTESLYSHLPANAILADNDPEMAPEKLMWRDNYLAAREAFNRAQYTAARSLFEALLPTAPGMHDLILRDLARIELLLFESSGASQGSLEMLQRYADILILDPASLQLGWAMYLRGRALELQSDWTSAEDSFKRVLDAKVGPPKDALYYHLGFVAEQAGRTADAYAYYAVGANVESRTNDGRCKIAMTGLAPQLAPAERGIDWVLEVEALNTLIKKGRDREALRRIQEAQASCHVPELKDDLKRMEGYCYLRLARHDEGMDALVSLMDEELTGGRPNWETLAYLQKSLGKRGDQATRMALLSRFVASAPPEEGAEAYFVLASLLKDGERLEEAEDLYRLVVARYPQSSHALEAQWLLAWGQIRRKEHEAALESLKTLVGLTAPASLDRARALYWTGRLTAMVGDPAAAEEIYYRITNEFSDSYYGAMASWRLAGQLPQVLVSPPFPVPDLSSKYPGEEPLELGPSLLFPGFKQHLEAVTSDTVRLGLMRAKELLLMDLNREAQVEVEAIMTHNEASFESRWIGAALSYTMKSIFYGVKNGHRSLELLLPGVNASPEQRALAYPFPYRTHVFKYAAERGINPFLVAALIQQESTFRADAVSPVGARGLMQIMPYTGKDIARWLKVRHFDSKQLSNPETNIRFGTEYLRVVLTQWKGDLVRTLASYNAGPNAVAIWVRRYGELEDDYLAEEIPYKETRLYVRLVIRNFYGYTRTYAGPMVKNQTNGLSVAHNDQGESHDGTTSIY